MALWLVSLGVIIIKVSNIGLVNHVNFTMNYCFFTWSHVLFYSICIHRYPLHWLLTFITLLLIFTVAMMSDLEPSTLLNFIKKTIKNDKFPTQVQDTSPVGDIVRYCYCYYNYFVPSFPANSNYLFPISILCSQTLYIIIMFSLISSPLYLPSSPFFSLLVLCICISLFLSR